MGLPSTPDTAMAETNHAVRVGQVENDPREEASLGHAEQKAHPVERPFAFDPHHRRGKNPPGNHDPCDPGPRAEFLQQEVAGDLEQKIADEEYARAGAESHIAQREVLEHLEFRKPHIHPVEVGEDVAEEEKGKQPPVDLGVGLGFEARNPSHH